ncbi:MAG: phospholipase [Azospira oryzae]|nr:MAG: phospholipase [Azospira oryzae]
MENLTIVFVHGWSVTNISTYGELPLRLREEVRKAGLNYEVKEIFLGKYISFHDEVRMGDLSRAFQSAVKEQLSDIMNGNGRFIGITHSTGGPVVRDWWHRYYENKQCPMSHWIMLAPANYGSALAQLGKGRLGRLKAWFDQVEPGQGVLDWLELGSNEAWKLNLNWIINGDNTISTQNVFPFVLTGQSIDRKLYDNLNSYTGELGSDGVVRVAAANLEARYILLSQPAPVKEAGGKWITGDLEITRFQEAPKTPLRIIAGKSHSGDSMGILKSVKKTAGNDKSSETVKAIFDCIRVKTTQEYTALYNQFARETIGVQQQEKIEVEDRLLLSDRIFIHDRFSMVIFKVVDSQGYAVNDFDLLITAGEESDPNHLPEGFFVDRQRNHVNAETITYYFNYDIMNGTDAVLDKNGKVIRPALMGIDSLGFEIRPRPEEGFIKYLPCRIRATKELYDKALVPNSTTLIEICLQRVVHSEVFQLDALPGDSMPTKKQGDFKNTRPGTEIVE